MSRGSDSEVKLQIDREWSQGGSMVSRAPNDAHDSLASGLPSAEELLAAAPYQQGFLDKRGVRLGCVETWRRRFFCLVGAYLWRFEDERAKRPKGVPIAVAEINAEEEDAETPERPYLLHLSTLRKVTTVSCASSEDRAEWVAAINSQKIIALKQEMGHLPVSDAVERLNRMGDRASARRERDRERERDRDEAGAGLAAADSMVPT